MNKKRNANIVLGVALLFLLSACVDWANEESLPTDGTAPTGTNIWSGPTADVTVPQTVPAESTVTTEPTEPDLLDGLPTLTYQRIMDGFLYLDDQCALSISRSGIKTVQLQYEHKELKRNGEIYALDYSWGRCGDMLCAISEEGIEPVVGSCSLLFCMIEGRFPYLINVDTGVVWDPLADVDAKITERLSDCAVSPDGRYMILTCNASTVCWLLDCTTGELVLLAEAGERYSVSGCFMGNDRILLTSSVIDDKTGDLWNQYAWYIIETGTVTDIPGLYTAKNQWSENYMIIDPRNLYQARTNRNGYLALVDLITMETFETQFHFSKIETIFTCGDGITGVIYEGVLYQLDETGNAQAVCMIERN